MPSFISAIRDQGPRLGIFITFNTEYAAQLTSSSGYDFVIIDMEHTPVSALEATHLVHAVGAASKGTCAPLVRVPSHGVEWIKWGLDSGAAGIIVPMVNSGDEAKQIVQKACYPPLGQRSFGPMHAPFAHPDTDRTPGEYFAKTAKGVAIFPMIESAKGVQNAEQILGTEGISGVFIGPFDLRVSLGLPGGDGSESAFEEALKTIVAAAKKLNKPVGIYTPSKEALDRNLKLGFEFFAYQGDSTLLAKAAKASVEEARSVIGNPKL